MRGRGAAAAGLMLILASLAAPAPRPAPGSGRPCAPGLAGSHESALEKLDTGTGPGLSRDRARLARTGPGLPGKVQIAGKGVVLLEWAKLDHTRKVYAPYMPSYQVAGSAGRQVRRPANVRRFSAQRAS